MKRFVLVLGLSFASLSCERIPEWERRGAQLRSNEMALKILELKNWIWTCRSTKALQSTELSQADRKLNSATDYFQSKNLSSLMISENKQELGTAILWAPDGLLVFIRRNLQELGGIECRNAFTNWSPVKYLGRDQSIDLNVLKLDSSVIKKKFLALSQRAGDLNLDENYFLVSSLMPGELDKRNVSLQAISPDLHSGLDSDLLIFSPYSASVAGGLLMDEKFRVTGIVLPIPNEDFGVAVSASKIDQSLKSILSLGYVPQVHLGFRLRVEQDGVFIQQVEQGSPAFRAGLKPEDQLLEWDGVSLKTASDWKEPVASEIGKSIHFKFKRGSSITEASLKTERRVD